MSRINLFVDTHVQYAYLKSGIKVLADERDKKKFLDFVLRLQQEQKFDIYAFCILDNEAHFLLGVQEEENEKTEAILGEMGNWYTNHMREQQFQQKRRGRVTKCISGVKDMEKMLTVCLRIHSLPSAQKYAKDLKNYWWSSYQSYRGVYEWQGVDWQFLLLYLDDNVQKARQQFIRLQRKETRKIKS